MDRKFHQLNEEVFQEIDCLKCANCCKTICPIFKERDIDRIARSLKMKPSAFVTSYLHIDDDGDYVLNQTHSPFLGKDNYCSIYNVRPKACREYPHTNPVNMHKYLGLAAKNLTVCPAVIEILKRIPL
ncbi:MAG: YkgJ family cysteine cluster protein [Bacteroidetes bacterium]|nr:YkgJ family cysteine cluster protein [Bacteroidota bacterium]MDA1121130.1 YkgJ family cysteine cluster protein [Bacteroidota bacterium]